MKVCPVYALSLILLVTATAAAQRTHKQDAITHYKRVEQELRAADVSHLTPAQRARRARVLAWLGEYRDKGVFGVNRDFPGARVPYFVDGTGRRCAVANLLDKSGRTGMTLAVARSNNYIWVVELAEHKAFRAWLDHYGISLAEAARIQGPRPRGGQNQGPGDTVAPGTQPRQEPRPSDIFLPVANGEGNGAGATTGGTNAPSAVGSTWAPDRRGAGRSAGPNRTAPRGISIADLPSQSWDTWWYWNKREFLKPQAESHAGMRQVAVQEIVPILHGLLKDRNAEVRAAAGRALGRIGGSNAVATLVKMLDDPVLEVREDTILALAATRSAVAVHTLLHIARHGQRRGEGREQISPNARPLAVIALGLARRYGSKVSTDDIVRQLTVKTKSAKRDLELAKLLYASLVDSKEMQDLARRLVNDERTPLDLRCRAIESLADAGDRESLVTLMNELGGKRVEARRSAALALGRFPDPLALQPLQTAYEHEHEHLVQAFAQLSIGRRGGREARAFLLENLRSGPKTLRPWAALGLGLLVRQQEAVDRELCDAIRAARTRETSRPAQGAYLVALGLARDAAAVGLMSESLHGSKNASTRVAAGEALALMGNPAARNEVRKRLQEDPCNSTRAALAEVLGYVGKAEDGKLLVWLLAHVARPGETQQIATALGMLPGGVAYTSLRNALRHPDTPANVRAAATEALAMMVSEHHGLNLAELAQNANFTLFPGWLHRIVSLNL